jgi:hypothetical protein
MGLRDVQKLWYDYAVALTQGDDDEESTTTFLHPTSWAPRLPGLLELVDGASPEGGEAAWDAPLGEPASKRTDH